MKRDIPLIIKEFNANRVPLVLPLKYKLMAENAFHFFRGTCHLYYQDLLLNYPFADSPLTWVCGDLHIENFGSFKGENRLVYFDMNDFDEGIQAPLLYEISRLLVSAELAAIEIGFSNNEKKILIKKIIDQYRFTLLTSKSLNIEQETATGLIKKLIKKVAERKEKDLMVKLTNNKLQNAKFLLTDRLLAIPKKEKKLLSNSFTEWYSKSYHKGYHVTDNVFRIAGTGSIGVKRYLFLLENENNPKQKRIVDIKQSLPSSILYYSNLRPPTWQNDADRIIKIQEMMQHVAPAYLSSFQFENTWYVAKEIQPTADRIMLDYALKQPQLVEKYFSDLGMLAASAQLRSSGRYHSATADELKYFATDDKWIPELTTWTNNYTEQVKQDYSVFCKARKDGYFKI